MNRKETRYEKLYRVHYQDVLRLLVRLGADRELARDLAQDTFERVYLKLDGYRGEGMRTWIWTIAKNTWSNHCRSRRAQRRAAEVPESVLPSTNQASDPTPWTPTTPSPERDALASERVAILNAVVNALPPRLQEVFVYRFRDGQKYREIADCMGVSLDTVKAQLHEARRRVRDALANADFEDEHG